VPYRHVASVAGDRQRDRMPAREADAAAVEQVHEPSPRRQSGYPGVHLPVRGGLDAHRGRGVGGSRYEADQRNSTGGSHEDPSNHARLWFESHRSWNTIAIRGACVCRSFVDAHVVDVHPSLEVITRCFVS